MVEIEIAPTAIRDMQHIIDYVFKKSVQNSEKLYNEFIEKIYSLQQFPERGKIVKEIEDSQVREIKLYHYRIIYRITPSKVLIITIHHSARLLSNNPNNPNLFK